MTIESVLLEQRHVIEKLLAEKVLSEQELRPLHERLSRIFEHGAEEQAAREHAAERAALDALERAAQASWEEETVQPCLEAVRPAFGGAAVALVIFDGIGAILVRALAGDFPDEGLESLAWEAAHKKEVMEVGTSLVRSLPLAGERRGALFIAAGERTQGATRRLLTSIADRLAHVLDLLERQHRASNELERLGEERALRERFVATLAHDLRGPLMAARISLECMQGNLTRPDLIQYARRALQSIGRADGMMRDLLDASRVRAGQPLPLQLASVDAGALVHELIDDLTPQYGPRFLLQVEAGLSGMWCARELRRALWNLLMNAIRHGAPARPIVVSVVREGERARITVENEGPAIADEALQRIFDPYQRRSGDGWGLGLTLVRACAEAHGGTVTVESGEGMPTVFTLRLPIDARPFYAELVERADTPAGRQLLEH